MLRIFKSLFFIVAVAAIAGGATWSYFTASYTVNGNTFSTSKIAFDLRKTNVDTQNLPFKFEKLSPGECAEDQLNIFNHGDSIQMKYRFYFTPKSGNPLPYDKIRFEAYKCDYFGPSPESHCASWPSTPTESGFLKDFAGADASSSIISPANLGVNSSHVWKFKLCLDESAGNAYQNKSATFDLTSQGTQVTNPGWSE